MAFTRSPYRLTRILSTRVEDDFPDRLAAASAKAGVPNGVLLGRLVDQFLGDEKAMTPQEHYEALGQSLGYANAAGPLPKRKRKKSTPESTEPAGSSWVEKIEPTDFWS